MHGSFNQNFLVVLTKSEYFVDLTKIFILTKFNQMFIDIQENNFVGSRKIFFCKIRLIQS